MKLNKIKTNFFTMLQAFKGNLTGTFFLFLLVGFAFATGSLYTKVRYLEQGVALPSKANPAALGEAAANVPTVAAKVDLAKPNSKDHIRGSKTAQIALIDYSDYSCPFCKRFNETLKQMLTQYDGKVQLIYRHFPLPSLHPNAQKQAEASECVFKLGGDAKFWTFSDQVYAATEDVTVDVMKKMAVSLGLDATKFNTCLDSGEMTSLVNADAQSGSKAGVNGTPGDFLYNIKTGEFTKLGGAVTIESLKTSIDAMLAK
jgi:protein-disulfide isomerase